MLYGLTGWTGNYGNSYGSVFVLNTSGGSFTNLHTFTNSISDIGLSTEVGLTLFSNTLYGATYGGGPNGSGAVFTLNTDGTGFANYYSFGYLSSSLTNSDGAYPTSLFLSGNTLFGTTSEGGSEGGGTIFSIKIAPPLNVPQLTFTNIPLTVTPYYANVILTWPTNFTGFSLESSTNLTLPAWSLVNLMPTSIGGQNVVIIPAQFNQQFFRLSQ